MRRAIDSFALAAILLASLSACVNNTNQAVDGGLQLDASLELDASHDAAAASDAGPDAHSADAAELDAGPLDESVTLPQEIRDAVPDLYVAQQTRRVSIYVRPSTSLSAAEVEHFLNAATDALTYNQNHLALSAEEIANEPRIRVVVLNRSSYTAATGSPDSYGVSFPAYGDDVDALVVKDDALSNLADFDDTLAHEINHVLIGRRAVDDTYIPWWVIEGTAVDMGANYAWEVHHAWTTFKEYWDEATGDDATTTFARYDLEDLTSDSNELAHDQAISGFFVEYLRFIHEHDGAHGYPDVHPRFLAASIATSEGASFAMAFGANFDGLTLANAKEAYRAFLQSTIASPSARYAGTVFE
ncbi:MAG: hypothetical protein IPK60_18465 [Sandaracinaceae bacterium]|nr:hypothetical protein [Sandaracinaceae bacterium]